MILLPRIFERITPDFLGPGRLLANPGHSEDISHLTLKRTQKIYPHVELDRWKHWRVERQVQPSQLEVVQKSGKYEQKKSVTVSAEQVSVPILIPVFLDPTTIT